MKTLWILVPLVSLDLVVQYIAGLGTNVYAPPNGFTMNTDFGFYDVHFLNGDVLGILSIILVIVAVFSRQIRNVAPSVVILASVIIAGFAGMAFANTTPNPPTLSLTMGIAFLVAFGTAISFMFRMRVSAAPGGGPPPTGATSA
jgi:hypothetical protein